MKTLSLLLLLTLGLGAAWWTQAHPGGTLEDVRSEAGTLAVRAGALLDRARGEAVDALGLAVGRRDDGEADDGSSPDVADTASLAPPDADTAGPATSPPADPDAADPIAPPPAGTDLAGTPAAAVDALAAAAAPADPSAFDARLEALAARLAEMDDESAGAADDDVIATVQARLAEAERRLEAAAEREASTLDRLAVIDERLVTLADRLDTLGMSRLAGGAGAAPGIAVDGVARDPGEANGTEPGDGTADGEPVEGEDTFADDARQADPIAGRLDTLAAGLDRRLAKLEARADGTAADASRLDALAERIDALVAGAALDGDGNAGANGGTGPAGSVESRELPPGDDDSVDAVQAAIRSELAEIGEQVGDGTASEDAPALGEALESTRERLATLEARVQSMPGTSASADAAKSVQDALEAQVRELERRLEALSEADPEIVDSISAVREQVDELASRGFVTQDELRAQTEGKNVEYKIYFGANRTDISEDAARVLDSFIAQEQNRTTGVSIFGFTDRRGSASYNQRLALERATNVRSYLIRNGLPYNKIRTLSGLGEDAAAAILPDDADDAQQRVVVLFAAQP